MNKPIINYTFLLFAVIAGFIACSSADDIEKQKSQEWSISTSAIKQGGTVEDTEEDGAQTRSLFIGGQQGTRFINIWDIYDVAQVYYGGINVGTLTPDRTGEKTANLVGTLTGSYSPGNVLTLYMPSADLDYEGQDGSIGTLSKSFDFMSTTVAVASVDGSTITTEPLTFAPKQAYVLLKFKNEKSEFLNVKKLTFTAASGKIVLKKTLDGVTTYTNSLVINTVKENSSENYPTDIYVALLDECSGNDTFSFTVEAADGNIYKNKSSWSRSFGIGTMVVARRSTICATVDVEMSTGITPSESDDADVDVREITL